MTGGTEMTTAQLSQAIHQLRAQAVLDHDWMQVVEEAVTQHAECIDGSRLAVSFVKADVVRIAITVESNDAKLKTCP